MISKKQLQDYVKRRKPRDLPKHDFFQLSVRLGKQMYRNCYDYNLTLADFEKIVNIYRDHCDTDHIKYTNWSIYQKDQLNLKVFPDGYSLCFHYHHFNSYRYQYKGRYEGRLVSCIRSQHMVDNFPTTMKYDNVIKVEKLMFPLDNKIELATYKKVDQEGIITYEVSLEIELGADFDKVVEQVKMLQKNAN